ncbi:MAG TPA: hypothetical protein VGG35_20590 [Streptosporangiaceae bacterium]|jgi:hypothetical protein
MTDPAGYDPASAGPGPAPAPRSLRDRLGPSRAGQVLRVRLAGHPLYVWLLWAAGALILASSPVLLSDPALWRLLVDPELVVLMVIVGAQYARLSIGMLGIRWRAVTRAALAAPARRRGRDPGPGQPGAPARPGGRVPRRPRLP